MYAKLLQELHEKRAVAWEAAKRHNDANELEAYNKAIDEIDALDKRISELEERKAKEERVKARQLELEQAAKLRADQPAAKPVDLPDHERRALPEYWQELTKFACSLRGRPNPAEYRTFRINADYVGGYLVAPPAIDTQILQVARDMIGVEANAKVITITGASYEGLNVNVHLTGVTIGTELSMDYEINYPQMTKRKLSPWPIVGLAKVSNDLLEVDAIEDPLRFITDQLIEAEAQALEELYLNGTGVSQPLGIMTPSADGVPVSQDVTAANATSITGDDLIQLQMALKPKYWQNAKFAFHRLVLREIRKLKTVDGQYLWQPGLQAGTPDLLLGKPVLVLEKLPATLSANARVGFYGDLSYYHIARRSGVGIKVEPHRYFDENKTAVALRQFKDGHPALGEAFVRLRMSP